MWGVDGLVNGLVVDELLINNRILHHTSALLGFVRTWWNAVLGVDNRATDRVQSLAKVGHAGSPYLGRFRSLFC